MFAVPVVAAILTPVATNAQGFRWPEKMENAKVLPESTTARELGSIMRGFTGALGVRCEHCHAGEPGQSLSEFDFVSDDKPAKEAARTMIRMVRAINDTYLTELGDDAVPVTCVTCHRGVQTPQPLEDVLAEVVTDGGADAAVARYRELREAYYGSAAYDFTEGSLLGLGQRMGESGKTDAAIAFFQLNTQFFPESGNTYMLLGQTLVEVGRREEGIEALETALDFVTNPRARARIEEMIDEATGESN